MKKITLFIFFSCVVFLMGQSQNTANNDGAFPSVKIGNQIWSTENLSVVTFRNGDVIPEAKTAKEWETYGAAGEAAWCYYEKDSVNGNKYGRLYNLYAVNDPRGLSPKGWHVPSDVEWSTLETYLGGTSVAGVKMKSNKGWKKEGNGTNSSNFSALPGGFRSNNGTFINIGSNGYWWSSPDNGSTLAWCRNLNYDNTSVGRRNNVKSGGFSVRLVKD